MQGWNGQARRMEGGRDRLEPDWVYASERVTVQPSVPAHSQLLVPSPHDQIIDPTELMLYFMQRSTPASQCI
ncbi:hypothetical protein PO909_001485 [Leuciscus waleckii]